MSMLFFPTNNELSSQACFIIFLSNQNCPRHILEYDSKMFRRFVTSDWTAKLFAFVDNLDAAHQMVNDLKSTSKNSLSNSFA